MRGDVDKPAVRTLLAEHFQSGFGAGENFRVGKHGRDGLYLIQDVRRGGIGNPQDQGARVRRRVLGATQVIDAGAGRVGNRKVVAQVALPVEQRMERQVVKEAMRSHDEMGGRREVALDGRDQLLVELAQVLVGRFQQLPLECAHVFWPETELRQLEAQQLEDAAQRRRRSQLDNLQVAAESRHT